VVDLSPGPPDGHLRRFVKAETMRRDRTPRP
jgi:hypothetical protein